MKYTILLGTGRKGRSSEAVAKYVERQVAALGHDTQFVDVRDFPLPATVPSWEEDDRASDWKHIVSGSDAIIVVMPEYNHGYPGELKMLWDEAYNEYAGKPVGLCAVSSGGLGGARVVENFIPILVACGAIVSRRHVYFSHVKDAFDADGNILDESYNERIHTLVEHLETLAK